MQGGSVSPGKKGREALLQSLDAVSEAAGAGGDGQQREKAR